MRITSRCRGIPRCDVMAPWTALAARYTADADWLSAVVAALDVIHAGGVAPGPVLLAEVLTTARCAVHGVAVLPDIRRLRRGAWSTAVDALASVAVQYTAWVAGETDGRAGVGGLGLVETRASLCLAVEILSLAARLALSIAARVERGRGWRRCCRPARPERR